MRGRGEALDGPAADALRRRVGRDEVGVRGFERLGARSPARRTRRRRSPGRRGRSSAPRGAGCGAERRRCAWAGSWAIGRRLSGTRRRRSAPTARAGVDASGRARGRSRPAPSARRARGSGKRRRGAAGLLGVLAGAAGDLRHESYSRIGQQLAPGLVADVGVAHDLLDDRAGLSGARSRSRMIGSVTLPSRRSLPIGLPSAASSAV